MTAQATMLTDEAIDGNASLFNGMFGVYSFVQGARFARDRYEARLAEDAKVRAQLVEALKNAKQRVVFDNEDDFDGIDYQPEAFDAVVLAEEIDAALAAAKEMG